MRGFHKSETHYRVTAITSGEREIIESKSLSGGDRTGRGEGREWVSENQGCREKLYVEIN